MDDLIRKSFVAGVERMVAWADLLDEINVYPVADGDTGRNLSISLAPLRFAGEEKDKVVRKLLLAARGNSGNIASQFFSAFYGAESLSGLKQAVQEGNARAWKAVADPRLGTMLSVFDALEEILCRQDFTGSPQSAEDLVAHLEQAVLETRDTLPKLKNAGVVDAGALGMYIFFEAFFHALAGAENAGRPVTDVFKGHLKISSTFQEVSEAGYCVDFVVKADARTSADLARLAGSQESAVIIR